jgi:hypothetical protein
LVNTTVKDLSLRHALIGDTGAALLADVLRVDTPLVMLSLRLNAIGDLGAGSLAEALVVNTKLACLSLHSNVIGAVGAASLARLPLDMVRRILTQYKVPQGKREWDRKRMRFRLSRD